MYLNDMHIRMAVSEGKNGLGITMEKQHAILFDIDKDKEENPIVKKTTLLEDIITAHAELLEKEHFATGRKEFYRGGK